MSRYSVEFQNLFLKDGFIIGAPMNLCGKGTRYCWLNAIMTIVFTEDVIARLAQSYIDENGPDSLNNIWGRISCRPYILTPASSLNKLIGQYILPEINYIVAKSTRSSVVPALTLDILRKYWIEVIIASIIRDSENQMKNGTADLFSKNAHLITLGDLYNKAITDKLITVEAHKNGMNNGFAAEFENLLELFRDPVKDFFRFKTEMHLECKECGYITLRPEGNCISTTTLHFDLPNANLDVQLSIENYAQQSEDAFRCEEDKREIRKNLTGKDECHNCNNFTELKNVLLFKFYHPKQHVLVQLSGAMYDKQDVSIDSDDDEEQRLEKYTNNVLKNYTIFKNYQNLKFTTRNNKTGQREQTSFTATGRVHNKEGGHWVTDTIGMGDTSLCYNSLVDGVSLKSTEQKSGTYLVGILLRATNPIEGMILIIFTARLCN